MAGTMKPLSMILVAVVLIAIAIAPRGEAVTCPAIEKEVQPCTPYILDKGPIGKCCAAVKSLVASLKTKADRLAACKCLQSLGKNQKGINFEKVDGLPKKCGVNAPYIVIAPSVDCTKIVKT